eukprot:snap_masked-scaffold_4-processed-gene-2.30-mRNA-1 protein AED:1.00 eAED:1.00 QI:0/0/0/0/1/1/2/0/85
MQKDSLPFTDEGIVSLIEIGSENLYIYFKLDKGMNKLTATYWLLRPQFTILRLLKKDMVYRSKISNLSLVRSPLQQREKQYTFSS